MAKTGSNSLGRLKSLGINKPSDLLLTLPRGYADYSNIETAFGTPDGLRHVYHLKLVAKRFVQMPRYRLDVFFQDDRGEEIKGVIWGDFEVWKTITPESFLYLDCVLDRYLDTPQLINVKIVEPRLSGRIAALYRGKKGVVAAATVEAKICEYFPTEGKQAIADVLKAVGMAEHELAKKIGFPNLATWLKELHYPTSMELSSLAMKAASTIAALEVIETARRSSIRTVNPHSAIPIRQSDIDQLIASLPFDPTNDQRQAIAEIANDLKSATPMIRLLSGDVGTGKTAAFLIPAIAAHRAGAKVAVMVPNTLLVGNALKEAREIDPAVQIHAHVPGKPFPPDAILVGTNSILSMARKQAWTPDLLIIDEQHRLSAQMRSDICEAHTNVLEASATAIPRTLALISHAGMDVSILAECPVKKQIETHILTRQDRTRLFNYLKLVVSKGHQIAIVYPLVTEKSEQDRNNRRSESAAKKAENGEVDLFDGHQVETRESIERVTAMLERQFPNNVGILHGRMSAQEKQSVIDRMKRKEINVLGASTAIELGVTMPSLKCILLIGPNTLGLASLHQLRGRLARHGGHGMCFIYLPNEVSETTMARYEAFASEMNGFTLSLLDMEMRGMGDISEEGEEQSGATKTLFKGLKIQPQDIVQLLQ